MNAILILVAAAGVSFAVVGLVWSELGFSAARSRRSEATPPLPTDSGERMFLGAVEPIEGTTVMSGELLSDRSGSGFGSSSNASEVRNVLFLDRQSTTARWLLPDDDHVITRYDITTRAEPAKRPRPVATMALVKPAHVDLEFAEGTLLLGDPSGRQVETVADGVRALQTASRDDDGRIRVYSTSGANTFSPSTMRLR